MLIYLIYPVIYKRKTQHNVNKNNLSFKAGCWKRLKNYSHGSWVYSNRECASTQKLIWGILGQSGVSIKFSTLMIREAKGPMSKHVDQIGPQGHPWRLQPVAWPFITCLEGLLMGERICDGLECEMRYVCIYTHRIMHVWMYIHMDVCGDNDVRDNKELADELSGACGHRGQKHVMCMCVCVILSWCVGWEWVLFSKS